MIMSKSNINSSVSFWLGNISDAAGSTSAIGDAGLFHSNVYASLDQSLVPAV
jgi:hypothetical protein